MSPVIAGMVLFVLNNSGPNATLGTRLLNLCILIFVLLCVLYPLWNGFYSLKSDYERFW